MPVRFGEEISSGAACNPAGSTVRNGETIGGENEHGVEIANFRLLTSRFC